MAPLRSPYEERSTPAARRSHKSEATRIAVKDSRTRGLVLADAHLHLFEAGFPGEYGRSPAGGGELEIYESLRRGHEIGRGLVVGYEGDARFSGNNEAILAYARERDWISPLAHVSPTVKTETLTTLLDLGFAGIVIYASDEESGEAIASWCPEALSAIDEHAGIVSINATPEATRALGPFVDAIPQASVLFSHLGLPGRVTRVPSPSAARSRLAPLLRLASRENTAVKLSGLYAISDPCHEYPHHAAVPYAQAVLEAFGPQRMLWGSDFPVCLDFVSFAQAAAAVNLLTTLTGGELVAVAGGNLIKLLDLLGQRQQ